MDQNQVSEFPTFLTRNLNATALEFIPSSADPVVTPRPVWQHMYPRPPPFLPPLPPPFYGYESLLPQNAMPLYGYNVNPMSHVELFGNCNNGVAAVPPRNEPSDAHMKILNQVEFYFSDINLATTDQLFTLMRKDPEGYVPIYVVASFKKIKHAVNGNTQLANILRSSKKQLVSKDGKKVKRGNPLTETNLQELQSRIMVAENLPEDHSHQNLMKLFSSVGSVKTIRTCPPQKAYNDTSSTSKEGQRDPMHFSGKFHAFVEYESIEEAEKAVFELKEESNWRNGLKVRLLLRSATRTSSFEDMSKPTEARAKKVGHEGEPIGRNDEADAPDMHPFKENQLGDMPMFDTHFHQYQWENSRSNNAQRKGFNSFCGRGNCEGKGKGQGRGWGGSISGSPPTENLGCNEKLTGTKTPVIPRMPDGTKGFSMGRGKPIAVKVA